jgi:hypothetical protein
MIVLSEIQKRMDCINNDEFSEVYLSAENFLICQIWMPASSYMSDWEFIKQINRLFYVVEFYKVKTAYIDASEFNYPIINKSYNMIKNYAEKTNIQVGLTNSKYLLGKKYIDLLLKSNVQIFNNVNVFESQEEGSKWLFERLYGNEIKTKETAKF